MIPLLKKLGFLNEGNVPTQDYRDYCESGLSGAVMARCIKKAYSKLFAASDYAYRLPRKDVQEKIKNVRYYVLIFCFEVSLRQLIKQTLLEEYGPN